VLQAVLIGLVVTVRDSSGSWLPAPLVFASTDFAELSPCRLIDSMHLNRMNRKDGKPFWARLETPAESPRL
jgi:hypothetical protein